MTRKSGHKQTSPPRSPLPVLDTGVPGLNDVLGGGVPTLSFNLVTGGPGSGKTTLAMQVLFANATPKRPGLYITLLGESSLKMLRYQQLNDYFETSRVGKDVHFLNLTEEALSGDLDGVLALVVAEVERLQPGIVMVDSFRALVRSQALHASSGELEAFIQQLAMKLATWEITSFLIGEYPERELSEPVFTVADGIIHLSQDLTRNSVVRRLQVVKARGCAPQPGLHTMRLSSAGVEVFPRTPEQLPDSPRKSGARMSTGIAGLDEMMGGGIPVGDSLVLAGPTGTGKTTFAMKFVAAGLAAGESAVIAIFEEHPDAYLERAESVDVDFRAAIAAGKLSVIYLRPLDLSVDETLQEIRVAVARLGATRVVIDSISGFEMALAPAFREDFRESFYRLIGALTGLGVTMYSTVEVIDGGGNASLKFTGYQVSFLTDDIISQRYVEIEGALQKALVVVKMRGSGHSREFRSYDITSTGVQLRESLREYDGILTGMPTRQLRIPVPKYPSLTPQEILVLEIMVRLGVAAPAAIAKQAGIEIEKMPLVLSRLVQLGYASKSGVHYQAEAGHTEP